MRHMVPNQPPAPFHERYPGWRDISADCQWSYIFDGWRVSVAKLIYMMYFRIVEKLRGNCVRREVYHPGNSTLEFRFYTIDVFTQSVPPEKFNAGISNMKSCLVDKLTRLFEFRRRNATWEILWFFLSALFFSFFGGDIPTSSWHTK